MKSSVVAARYSVLFVFYRFTSPRLDNEHSLLFDKVRCTSQKQSVKKYKKDNNVSGLHRTQRTPNAPRCALTSIFFPWFFFFYSPNGFRRRGKTTHSLHFVSLCFVSIRLLLMVEDKDKCGYKVNKDGWLAKCKSTICCLYVHMNNARGYSLTFAQIMQIRKVWARVKR